ncbi:MAG: hypothetical protein JKY46_07735 [Robiginitomaculum sp.]|nr:hypothetical protein [Robiginitomaculum sp.]
MKTSVLIIALGVSLAIPGFSFANDSILQQLRDEADGYIISDNTIKQVQNIQVQPVQWSKPVWMSSGDKPQGFSAKAQSGNLSSYSPSGSNINLEAVIAWDSENIFRGLQESKQTIAGGIEISSANLYGGVWAVAPVADSFSAYQDRIDIYAGYGFDLNNTIQADIGVAGYIRPQNGLLFAYDDSIEAYAGISLGGEYNPAFYAFYDFVLERFVFEASAEYIIPIARTDLVFGGTLGYSDDNGFDFGYAQADVEIVQNFNRNLSISVGGHFAAATETTFLQGLALSGKNSTWFGLRLRASQ